MTGLEVHSQRQILGAGQGYLSSLQRRGVSSVIGRSICPERFRMASPRDSINRISWGSDPKSQGAIDTLNFKFKFYT